MVNMAVFVVLASSVVVNGRIISPNIKGEYFQKELIEFCK